MTDSNREAFEANAIGVELDVTAHEGEYDNEDTQRAWTFWQAACDHEKEHQKRCRYASYLIRGMR